MNLGLKLPKRSAKYGVGKLIGGALYLHRKSEGTLGDIIVMTKQHLPEDVDYQIVKYNERSEAVSFVQCADFDSAAEPTVGDIVTVNSRSKGDTHHSPWSKWP